MSLLSQERQPQTEEREAETEEREAQPPPSAQPQREQAACGEETGADGAGEPWGAPYLSRHARHQKERARQVREAEVMREEHAYWKWASGEAAALLARHAPLFHPAALLEALPNHATLAGIHLTFQKSVVKIGCKDSNGLPCL